MNNCGRGQLHQEDNLEDKSPGLDRPGYVSVLPGSTARRAGPSNNPLLYTIRGVVGYFSPNESTPLMNAIAPHRSP